MRNLRILVVLFFIASCAVYGVHMIKEKATADNNAPVIYMESELLEVGQGAMEEDLLVGVTAKDEESGDITERIQVASMSRFQNDGTRIIKYIVFDDANQLGQAERRITYNGYVPPRIYLKEPLRFTSDDYVDRMEGLLLEAKDFIDGDLTNKIRIAYGQDMYKVEEGNYPVTFQVNNSAGDTCLITVDIQIIDGKKENGKYYPLLKDYIVYVKQGEAIDFSSNLEGIASKDMTYIFGAEDTPRNINANSVSIKSNVDKDTPGVYTVNYSYTTRDRVTATTVLYVVVEG